MHAVAGMPDARPRGRFLAAALGLGTADQLVPSQDSIRVVEAPLLV